MFFKAIKRFIARLIYSEEERRFKKNRKAHAEKLLKERGIRIEFINEHDCLVSREIIVDKEVNDAYNLKRCMFLRRVTEVTNKPSRKKFRLMRASRKHNNNHRHSSYDCDYSSNLPD